VNVSSRSITRIAPFVGFISSASTASYSISDASGVLRISLYRDSATDYQKNVQGFRQFFSASRHVANTLGDFNECCISPSHFSFPAGT